MPRSSAVSAITAFLHELSQVFSDRIADMPLSHRSEALGILIALAVAAALDQGINLFKMFDFVKASGNLMVIFSDGEDTQATLHGRPISDILATARAASIPVFFVRTNRDKALGAIVPDALWKSAVESTGGAFYAAARETDIERAIEDIDRKAPGVIRVKQYTANQPFFAPFAAAAAALWSIAILLRLAVPQFSRFP